MSHALRVMKSFNDEFDKLEAGMESTKEEEYARKYHDISTRIVASRERKDD